MAGGVAPGGQLTTTTDVENCKCENLIKLKFLPIFFFSIQTSLYSSLMRPSFFCFHSVQSPDSLKVSPAPLSWI
jgi:hypothetical protein